MRVTLLFIAILLAFNCQAQNPLVLKYSNTITAKDLEKHLKIIASDKYQGRETGEKGLEMAADYISKEFKSDKLAGPVTDSKNKFYQQFELQKKTWTKVNLTAGNENADSLKNFGMIQIPEGTNEFEVVFAGYGIFMQKYNDFKNINIKGKIVACVLGEPKDKSGIYLTTYTSEPSVKKDTATQSKFKSVQSKIVTSLMRGAKGIIIIDENDIEADKTIKSLNEEIGLSQISFPGVKNLGENIPIIYMSPTEAARMFGISNNEFEKAIADSVNNGVSPGGSFTQKIKIEAVRKTETIKTENVLGFIEGTDKKDEIVVICAHYDHLGIKNGTVYNGADDNGSGTVGLLELSEAFAKAKADKNGTRRSLLFIALTGEEEGLFGSKYYAAHPVLSLPNTVTALNIDMIGRVDKEHAKDSSYIYLIGSDYMSSELDQLSKEAARIYTPQLKLDYTLNDKNNPERLYYRSDQISFAEKGVPVIFYYSGEHSDYHKPTDDVNKINYKLLEERLHLVFATAWELANRDERVKVDKK
jgi:hypothetical protein